MNGLHLVHKPVGPSSFAALRSFLGDPAHGQKLHACHGGTLDPFARGLLLVLVGPATHLMELFHPLPKTYVAEVAWGAETDNGDPGGKIVGEGDASALTPERLEEALRPFLGWTEQVPPPTSAKKLGGEPAYKKAHRGEEVSLPPSRVYLHSARWLRHALPSRSALEVVVRGGYYVRALARDLGRAVGARAHLAGLARTQIGPWVDPGEGVTERVVGREVFAWRPARELTDAEVGGLRRGETISAGRFEKPRWSVPPGFPDPGGPVAGLHLGKLAMLLREAAGGLTLDRELRGGI